MQRGTGASVSCALAVQAANVTLRDLHIKSTSGRALAFGTGATASSTIASGVVGCEQSPLATCNRGQPLGQNGGDAILITGNASPTIGPATAPGPGTLQLGPSLGAAIAVVDTATPLI